MADSQIASLFMTPEMYQQAQNEQALARANQFAQLDPLQRAAQSMYYGGYQAGNAIAGALGAQDPQMQLLSARRSILQNIDPNDERSLALGAQKAAQSGDGQLVTDLMARIKGLSDIRKEQATAAKTAQEVGGVSARAQALMEEPGMTETKAKAIASSDKAFADYTASKKIQTPADYAVAAGSLGIPVKSYLSEYTPTELHQMEQQLFKHKAGIAAAGRTTIINQQEGEVTKSNVAAFSMLRDNAMAAANTIQTVDELTPLIKTSFTGVGADSKLKAGQLAEFFGVPITGTSETEQLRSLQTQLKLGNAQKLKGNFSDRDMAIVGEAVGSGVTAGGLQKIMSGLRKNAMINQLEYQRANEYQQRGKLSEYDFVKGSKESRDEVDKKWKRLQELESKAQGGQ